MRQPKESQLHARGRWLLQLFLLFVLAFRDSLPPDKDPMEFIRMISTCIPKGHHHSCSSGVSKLGRLWITTWKFQGGWRKREREREWRLLVVTINTRSTVTKGNGLEGIWRRWRRRLRSLVVGERYKGISRGEIGGLSHWSARCPSGMVDNESGESSRFYPGHFSFLRFGMI